MDRNSVRMIGWAAMALVLGGATLPVWAAGTESPSATMLPTNEPGVFAHVRPPAGFDPLSASDEELANAGFPPRPDATQAPAAHQHWKRMVTAPQVRVEQPLLQRTAIENRPASDLRQGAAGAPRPGANSVSAYSGNWSGFAVYGPNGTYSANNSWTFTEFVVPAVQQAFGVCNGTWDYSSLWTGFDGWGSGDVLQAGIEADAYCANVIGTQVKSTYYSAWYEWYPAGSVRISNVAVNPGNAMAVEVWYTTSAPNGHAYIINYDTQQSVSLSFSIPAGTGYAGNSVEWVVESPTVSGSLATLSNYIVAPFNFNYAWNGSSYTYPGSGPAGTTSYSITMEPGSSPLSFCSLYSPYVLWCEDEGTAY